MHMGTRSIRFNQGHAYMGSSTSMQQRPMIQPMAEPEVSPQKNALGNEGDDEQHDRVERMVKQYTRLVERILSRRKMQNTVDSSGGNSNKCIMTFPQKLYLILKMAPSYGFDHTISWQPHGRSFVIRKRDLFVSTIAPRIFETNKYTSFQRQLNLYDFQYIPGGSSSVDRGAYYHENFLRGSFHLCRSMARVRMLFGDKSKDFHSVTVLPDFYALPHCHDDNEDLLSAEAQVDNDKDQVRGTQDAPPSEDASIATNYAIPDRVMGVKRPSSSCVEGPNKLPNLQLRVNSDASVTLYQGMVRGTNIYTNTEHFTIDDFNEVMKI